MPVGDWAACQPPSEEQKKVFETEQVASEVIDDFDHGNFLQTGKAVLEVIDDFDPGPYIKEGGDQYLALRVGDRVEQLGEDSGWAWGKRLVQPGEAESTLGWYPASFVTPVT